jgi:hypothetical protein
MGLGDWEDIGKTLPDASYGTVTTAAALLRSMRSDGGCATKRVELRGFEPLTPSMRTALWGPGPRFT